MDTVRGLDDRLDHDMDDGREDVGGEPERTLDIGTDERRMHVRAYNHWVSLLGGRAYPSIEDLNPEGIADFGPNSVLLDFSAGVEDPTIQFLGRALREECGVDAGITRVADVPSRSLLSRLTDHYLQIIANRAPIGFEAEFVSQRGHTTMYRGILMPFSSDEDTIDFIYGVINWKEMVDAATQARLNKEIDDARRASPRPPLTAPVWADGPSAGASAEPEATQAPLADRLALARESAAALRAADTRSRSALYRALGRAYDFALDADADTDGYRRLLDEAGIKAQARAPMTAIAKLVFGSDYDKARLTEFAAVLSHARRHQIAAGGLGHFIEQTDGGMKGIVRAEREARRPASRPVRGDAAAPFRARPAVATVPLPADGDEFVLLLARANDADTLDVVARVAATQEQLAQALRRAG